MIGPCIVICPASVDEQVSDNLAEIVIVPEEIDRLRVVDQVPIQAVAIVQVQRDNLQERHDRKTLTIAED